MAHLHQTPTLVVERIKLGIKVFGFAHIRPEHLTFDYKAFATEHELRVEEEITINRKNDDPVIKKAMFITFSPQKQLSSLVFGEKPDKKTFKRMVKEAKLKNER